MQGAVLVIILLIPTGQVVESVPFLRHFDTMEQCQSMIPVAHDLAKKNHQPNSPYIITCTPIETTPKEPI